MTGIGSGSSSVNPSLTDNSALNDQMIQAGLQFNQVQDLLVSAGDQLGAIPTPPPGTGTAGKPSLTPPNPNASTAKPSTKKPAPTTADSFTKSFNTNLNAMAAAKNLTATDVKNLQFMLNNPGVSLDDPNEQDKLQGDLQTILTNVQSDLTSQGISLPTDPKTGLLQDPPSLQTDYQNQMATAYDAQFEQALAKLGLSPADAAKVEYAHFNPGSQDPAITDPKIQAALKQAEGAAVAGMKALGFIIPSGFKPPTNAAAFNAKNSAEFSEAMETAIQNLGKQAKMSDTQIKGLINSYYNPAPSGKVPAIISQAQAQVMKDLGPQLGLPSSPVPQPNTAGYNATLSSQFIQQFQANLSAMPLTSQQLTQVRAAMANPALMTPALQSIINTAWTQAVGQIQQANGLPITWNPTVTQSEAVTPNPAANVVNQADEVITGLINQIGLLPPSPGNTTYINFLGVVSAAINALRQSISAMQGLQSQVATKDSKAQCAASLKKAADKTAKMKEVNDMLAKAGQQKIVGPVVEAVIVAVLVTIAALMFCDIFGGEIVGAIILAIVTILVVIFAIASNVVGASPSADPTTKQALSIMDMIMQAIAMIVMTVVTFGAATGPMAAELAAESADMAVDASTAALKAGELAFKTADEGGSAAEETALDALNASVKGAQDADSAVQNVSTLAKAAAKALEDGAEDAPELAKEAAEAGNTASQKAIEAQALAQKAADAVGAAAKEVGSGAKDAVTTANAALKPAATVVRQTANTASILTEEATEAGADMSSFTTTVTDAGSSVPGDAGQSTAKEGMSTILDKLKDTAKGIADKYENLMDTQNQNLKNINIAGQLAQSLPEIAKSSADAANSANQAKIALLQGAMEAYQIEMDTLIKLLQKIISLMLGSVTDLGTMLQNVGDAEQDRWKGLFGAISH